MERKEFEEMVLKVMEELPRQFRDKLENVDIVIEDAPDMRTVRALGLGSRGRLLGLYQGVPLKDRTHYYGMVMPDKITLYMENIERSCGGSAEDVYKEVKYVIEHEIAHHFGITDKRLRDIGAY